MAVYNQPDPAVSDGDMRVDQDYQLEVWVPSGSGMIQIYVIWRQFQMNADTDQDSDLAGSMVPYAMG